MNPNPASLALRLAVMMLCFFAWNGLLAQEVSPQTIPEADGSDSGYALGPGDQVRVSVFNQSDLTGDYVIDGDGRISMPLIGAVVAKGLTPSDLEDLLVSKLKPDYLVNPLISVEVSNYRPYYLIGEVRGTGAYPYIDGISYLTAIAIAGGFTYRSKKNHVYVIRVGSEDGDEIKVDINEKVEPGDIIRVAERLF